MRNEDLTLKVIKDLIHEGIVKIIFLRKSDIFIIKINVNFLYYYNFFFFEPYTNQIQVDKIDSIFD